MVDAIAAYGKYETRVRKHVNVDGVTKYETRRETNARFNQSHKSPEIEIPPVGEYLWEWYFDLDDRISRVIDGSCRRIPPSEWLAWVEITGTLVHRWELDILAAMDHAYSAALSAELADEQERQMPKPPGSA